MSKQGTGWLYHIFPFLKWLPELRSANVLRADLLAGITVALVLIPQSMAYAQLAGLPPYFGLYAAFLPPALAALFGSSRQLATGPVAVVSLLSAAALEPLATAGSEQFIAYAIMLAFIVGLFQMSLGLLRLGVLVNFLSHPVVIGFSSAAAIIIGTSQLGKIFGVAVEKAPHHYETVWNTIVVATTDTHMTTLMIAILAFVIMVLIRKISPKLPNVLIAVAITTLLSWAISFEKRMEVNAAQFKDETIRNLISRQLSLDDDIEKINKDIAKTELRYNTLKKNEGINDVRTLAAAHFMEEARIRLEDRLELADAEVSDLKHLKFTYQPGDAESGAFTLGMSGTPRDQLWQFTGINEDGSIMMRSGGHIVGTVPEGLPGLKVPTFDWSIIVQLFFSAVAIALIGFMEAISVAKAMAARTRQRVDANQELIGQGLSNIVGSMFQSYAVSGSFSRSAVNINSGALTGFSSVITTLIVIVTLLWLTPLLYHLPQATLAAVIMLAVIGLVNFKGMKHIWQIRKSDGIVAILTFVLTLVFAPHLDRAIMIGVILSLGIFLYQSMKPRVVVLSRHPDGSLRDAELFNLATCENISMIRFDGPLYFANTSYFEDKVLEKVADKPELKFVIVDGQGINDIDATGEEMLSQLTERLEKTGIQVIFTQFKKQVMDVLWQSGFTRRMGAERFCRRTETALDQAWQQLDEEHEIDCPLNVVCRLEPPEQKAEDEKSSFRRLLRF